MPEFVEWKKIFRLHREWEVTEKIDGTNGVLYWSEETASPLRLAEVDGLALYAGSRNRWLTPDADNFGFSRWAADNADVLRQLGLGYHFGEWMGLGIQRGYGLNEKRFLLFDHARHYKRLAEIGPTIPVGAVPFLGEVKGELLNQGVDESLDFLTINGSMIGGFRKPEGIVIRHKQSNTRFKVLLDGDNQPKSMKMTEVTNV